MDFFDRCLWAFIIAFLLYLPFCLAQSTKQTKHDFVYDRITLEIQPTFEIENLDVELAKYRERLHDARICHRDRIHVIVKPIVPLFFGWWTREMVLGVNRQCRTVYDGNLKDRHLFVFVAVLDGEYLPKKKVAGLAFKDYQFILLFRRFTFYALVHETAHIMGMVNREQVPVNPKRPPHCNNKDCVMYWQVNRLGRFDERCQADIDLLRDISQS